MIEPMAGVNSTALALLNKRFMPDEIEWRVGMSGFKSDGKTIYVMPLAYVTARAIMNRLDLTVGPENWKDEYQYTPEGMLCGLSIKVGGEWIAKWDGSPESNQDGFKGSISGALKRAAVKWGIGRYLYYLPQIYVDGIQNGTSKDGPERGKFTTADKKTIYYRWTPPKLPNEFLPEA